MTSCISNWSAYPQIPVNTRLTPLERVIVPVNLPPDTAFTAPGAVNLLDDGKLIYEVAVKEPNAPTVQPPVRVKALFVPAQVMVTPVTVPLAEPVLVRERWAPDGMVAQVIVVVPPPVTKAEAGSDWPDTVICVAIWDWEIVPKTKPPTAKEATTAMAIVSTVARIGLTALRFSCLNSIFTRRDCSIVVDASSASGRRGCEGLAGICP